MFERKFFAKAGLVLVLFLLAALAVLPGHANSAAQPPPPGQAALDKADALRPIAPWVLEHTAQGEQAEFLVVLAEQADLSSAAALPTRLEKGRYVREVLWNKARATQKPLLRWLEANGIEHRPYYIVNLIWVKGNRDVVLKLASRPDVAHIEGNPRISNFRSFDYASTSTGRPRQRHPVDADWRERQEPQDKFPTPNSQLPTPNLQSLISNFQSPREASNLQSPTSIESNITYVHAPEVWAIGFTGQGIVVGGQDTGYDWDHAALKPHYRGWDGATANHDYNWHDAVVGSSEPVDPYGHGTHTMGTIVGDDGGANQIGMAPGAQWIGCRNMDSSGYGTPATYLECFEFFLAPYPVGGTPVQGDPDKAPDVTNNSWTCPSSEGCLWSTLQAAVEAQRTAGIMTVVSAGNSGSACSTIREPSAIYEAAYSVGALQKGTDIIASFSSRGPVTVDGSNRLKPDISAPGTSIRSCYPGGGYISMQGTSMAAPHVAGAVALLWSARPVFRGQITITEQLFNQSAVHISSSQCDAGGWPNNVYGYGRLDAEAAVNLALDLNSGRLTGVVSDSLTSAPVVSASVQVTLTPALTFSTTSGLDGTYSMRVPSSVYTVTASAPAYFPVAIGGVSVLSGTTTTLNISLTPSDPTIVRLRSFATRGSLTMAPLLIGVLALSLGTMLACWQRVKP